MKNKVRAAINILIPVSAIIFFTKIAGVSIIGEKIKSLVSDIDKIKDSVMFALNISSFVYNASLIAALASFVCLIIWLIMIMKSKGLKYLLRSEKALLAVGIIWAVDVVFVPLFYIHIQEELFYLVSLAK
ncbi:hypothetical protein LCGC14_0533820 [marine sediment metagenome]|uniref:Uncharacterized protein n=1 Tax=marine sediment metagenome TaxID=412755 RepID=A0A0F9RZK8_9ZZZZ|nr:hypothetical protein [Actinomycetota bacterium]